MTDFNIFPFERNRYFYGKLLTVRDFELEQEYNSAKRRVFNRALVGPGVACGMGVGLCDESTIMIESGLAFDYLGREVVIKSPLTLKLAMIDGYDSLGGAHSAYLCAQYAEEEAEPVNAVGADAGNSSQFNRIREGCRLYLTSETPDFASLLKAAGYKNAATIFSDKGLSITLFAPGQTVGARQFTVGALIVKNEGEPPVSFSLKGRSEFFSTGGEELCLRYDPAPGKSKNVAWAEFKVRALMSDGADGALFSSPASLCVERGESVFSAEIEIGAMVRVCPDSASCEEYAFSREGLLNRIDYAQTPLYLAKLELINASGTYLISDVLSLPFNQRLSGPPGKYRDEEMPPLRVSARSSQLEYWQKPDVSADYDEGKNMLNFDFALPSPQAYDYAVSHGVARITLSTGMRVNTRYLSDEIAHGLGAGNVSVNLAIEFSDGERAQLFGNSEVFKSRSKKVGGPWAEAAAIVYPERGTMRIGLWLHDNVDSNQIIVHYYAVKPMKDAERIYKREKPCVSVLPGIARLAPRDKLRFKAVVTGVEDKAVVWEVKDENGGSIDERGIYAAPEAKGTYEITAKSAQSPGHFASAFVIVE